MSYIADNVFFDCPNINAITAAEGLTSILFGLYSQTAFYNGESNRINGAFYISDYLVEVSDTVSGAYTVQNGTKAILSGAFSGCGMITDIALPESVTYISGDAFYGCRNLESITVDKNNTVYHSENNCLIKTADKTLAAGCKNSVIPEDIAAIGSSAFQYCTGLTQITIPDGVLQIGDYAFSGCAGLTRITVPETVAEIGYGAFNGCENLTIYGKSGSAAQSYALNNGVAFVDNDCTHAVKLYAEEIPATCYFSGYTAGLYCENGCGACGGTESCDFGEWTVIKEATIRDGGERERVCLCPGCGYVQTQTTDKLPSTEITDEVTGAAVNFDETAFNGDEVTVVVENESEGEVFSMPQFRDNSIKVFNITVFVDGEETEPESPVLVKLPIPDGFKKDAIAVYHMVDGVPVAVDDIIIEAVYVIFFAYSFSDYIIANESGHNVHSFTVKNQFPATCTNSGCVVSVCSVCGEIKSEAVEKLKHTDNNADGFCDVCGSLMPTEAAAKCTCGCHSTGLRGLFWRIKVIFWEVFNVTDKRYCACGEAHW